MLDTIHMPPISLNFFCRVNTFPIRNLSQSTLQLSSCLLAKQAIEVPYSALFHAMPFPLLSVEPLGIRFGAWCHPHMGDRHELCTLHPVMGDVFCSHTLVSCHPVWMLKDLALHLLRGIYVLFSTSYQPSSCENSC